LNSRFGTQALWRLAEKKRLLHYPRLRAPLSLDATLAYPGRKRRFVNLTCGKREHRECGVSLCCGQAITIEREEQARRQKSRAFIAIDERLIFSQTMRVTVRLSAHYENNSIRY
jgi:hypothetical protein